MFLVLFVNLSVSPPDYSKSIGRKCINFHQIFVSGEETIDLILGMIRITTRMQDPHYDRIT